MAEPNSVEPAAMAEFPETLKRSYLPLAVLGRGAQAMVFRCRQQALDREVVVKLLRSRGAGDPNAEARFLREARILAQIRHPNVVELLDFGRTEEESYMVYPFERGRTVAALLASRKDTPRPMLLLREAAPLLDQVLMGLEAVHAEGVVHRDLKPSNLLLTSKGAVRILDFGLASLGNGSATLTGDGVVGTPLYMAPDQVQGKPPDPSDDLYAVGMLAWELLAGRHPFRSSELAEILDRQLFQNAPNLEHVIPGVPEGVGAWVRSLMAKARTARPRSAAEARERLRAAAPDDSSSALPRDMLPPPTQAHAVEVTETQVPLRRPGRPISSLVAGVAILGLVLGVLWFPGPGPGGEEVDRAASGESVEASPAGHPQAPTPEATGIEPWPGLASRVETELDVWFDRLPPADGAEVRFDPLLFPEGPGALPGLAEVRTWLQAGGSPDRLAPAALRELARVDAAFQALGLPTPFAHLVDLAPASAPVAWEEGDVPRFLLKELGQDDAPAQVAGWLATAVSETRRLARALGDLEVRLERAIARRKDPDLPASLIDYLAMGQGSHRSKVFPVVTMAVLGRGVYTPGTRLSLVGAFETAHLAWRRALAALAFSLREVPGSAVEALALLRRVTDGGGLGVAALGPGLLAHEDDLMPGMPDSPTAWFSRFRLGTSRLGTEEVPGDLARAIGGRTVDAGIKVLGFRDPGEPSFRLRALVAYECGGYLRQSWLELSPVATLGKIVAASRGLDPREQEHLLRLFLGGLQGPTLIPDTDRFVRTAAWGPGLAAGLAAEFPRLADEVRTRWPSLPAVPVVSWRGP